MPSTQTFAYGLISPELHRASERRTTERRRDQIATALHLPGRVYLMRQRLGDAMIHIGANVAGEPAPTRRTVPAIHPTSDLA